MGIPHLLALSLLISASVAPALAQDSDRTPSAASPEAPQSAPSRLVPPMRFGAGPASAPPDAKSGLPVFSTNQFKLSPKVLNAIRRGNNPALTQLAQPRIPSRVTVPPGNQTVCYAIRSYDFTRDDPASDATRFTGSATCQSVASVQWKAVSNPRAGALR